MLQFKHVTGLMFSIMFYMYNKQQDIHVINYYRLIQLLLIDGETSWDVTAQITYNNLILINSTIVDRWRHLLGGHMI